MSDRDTILRTLGLAESRIRINRILDRLAFGLAVWTGFGVLVKLVDLVRPFAPGTIRIFWILWFLGAAGVVVRSLGFRRDLGTTAREIDRRARLEDEVLSAWWFLARQKDDAPWVELHLHRAAARIRGLDVGSLCPRVLPRMSWLAAGGLVLLVALHLAPLPFGGWAQSEPGAPPDEEREADTLMEEIEDLLARAEDLEPDGTLQAFRQLMEEIGDPAMSLAGAASDLEDFQSGLDEGNLSTLGILEGLEDMAEELMAASDTLATGEALAEGDLEGAAGELDRLAGSLGDGGTPGEGLAGALARAAEESRAGLEALSSKLAEAAQALGSDDNAAAGEALAEAAAALSDLSDRIDSQALRNQASERIDDLQEALERGPGDAASESSGGEQDAPSPGEEGAGAPQPGQSGAGTEAMETDASSGGSQPSGGDAPPPGSQAEPGEGDRGQPGSLEGAAGGDTGMIPSGLGFSPDQKTGQATSLAVQLQQEATEALPPTAEIPPTRPPEEEATAEERSRLDYRNVPSALTPAQQELLNQEQIPREYRNLIRDYFQAIRPAVER